MIVQCRGLAQGKIENPGMYIEQSRSRGPRGAFLVRQTSGGRGRVEKDDGLPLAAHAERSLN